MLAAECHSLHPFESTPTGTFSFRCIQPLSTNTHFPIKGPRKQGSFRRTVMPPTDLLAQPADAFSLETGPDYTSSLYRGSRAATCSCCLGQTLFLITAFCPIRASYSLKGAHTKQARAVLKMREFPCHCWGTGSLLQNTKLTTATNQMTVQYFLLSIHIICIVFSYISFNEGKGIKIYFTWTS